jgi:hypothetical protein
VARHASTIVRPEHLDRRLAGREAGIAEVRGDRDAGREVLEGARNGKHGGMPDPQGVQRRFTAEETVEQVVMSEAQDDEPGVELGTGMSDHARRITMPDLDGHVLSGPTSSRTCARTPLKASGSRIPPSPRWAPAEDREHAAFPDRQLRGRAGGGIRRRRAVGGDEIGQGAYESPVAAVIPVASVAVAVDIRPPGRVARSGPGTTRGSRQQFRSGA